MPQLSEPGLWVDQNAQKTTLPRQAVFLDRDGVIVDEVHFLRSPEAVRLTHGIAAAIAATNRRQIPVVMITNQSGIARGHFTWTEFEAVHQRMLEQLELGGAKIDLALACAYHEDGLGLFGRDHEWRKPRPGMILEARQRLNLDLENSLLIGDRVTDIEAARAAGVRYAALAETGYGRSQWAAHGELLSEWTQAAAPRVQHAADGATAIFEWLNRR